MSRPLKPLSAYPSQLRALSLRAAKHQSVADSLFPISIPYDTSTLAMEFRVLFYAYRRSLRLHVQALDTPDSDLLVEAHGAELIQSPRISPTPDTANGKYLCTFRLSYSTPTQVTGLSALDSLLTAQTTAPKVTPTRPHPSETIQPMPKPKPEPKPMHRPAKATPVTHLDDALVYLSYRGTKYAIPVAYMPEDYESLNDKALGIMLVNNLIDLPNDLTAYEIV
jgi:hypothetical protein